MSRVAPKKYKLKTGETLVVRTAVPDDAECVLKHMHAIVAENKYNVTTTEDVKALNMTVRKEQQWINEHTNKHGNAVFIGEINETVVAMAHLDNGRRRRIAHVGTLHISVLKKFRSIGIGTALMQSTIAWAKQDPLIEKVCLEVFVNNNQAIALYKKLGFIEEGRRTKQIKFAPGKYVDSILMYKFVTD